MATIINNNGGGSSEGATKVYENNVLTNFKEVYLTSTIIAGQEVYTVDLIIE